jgi:hypothetical protein
VGWLITAVFVCEDFFQATPRLEGGIEAIVDAQLEGNYPQDIYLDMAQLAVQCSF